jgi:hypothetical protein
MLSYLRFFRERTLKPKLVLEDGIPRRSGRERISARHHLRAVDVEAITFKVGVAGGDRSVWTRSVTVANACVHATSDTNLPKSVSRAAAEHS